MSYHQVPTLVEYGTNVPLDVVMRRRFCIDEITRPSIMPMPTKSISHNPTKLTRDQDFHCLPHKRIGVGQERVLPPDAIVMLGISALN
jgi:hypothetical protein